jgi:hypothetical protein
MKNRNSVLSRGGKNALSNYSYAEEFVYQNQQKNFDIINHSNRYRETRLRNFPKLTLEDKFYEFKVVNQNSNRIYENPAA